MARVARVAVVVPATQDTKTVPAPHWLHSAPLLLHKSCCLGWAVRGCMACAVWRLVAVPGGGRAQPARTSTPAQSPPSLRRVTSATTPASHHSNTTNTKAMVSDTIQLSTRAAPPHPAGRCWPRLLQGGIGGSGEARLRCTE